MKARVYDLQGKAIRDIELPKIFNQKIREDIVAKHFEAEKIIQPYAHDPRAGRKHSASGTISHKRHDWKGHYGKGISRVPRKTMWRRGTQFYWIGAEISGARGGRRVHGPKGIGREKKINKKEIQISIGSGFASTINENYIIRRYASLKNLKIKFPVVLQTGFDSLKTKEAMKVFKEIFGTELENFLKRKHVRAGKGKSRGRKYKSNAGILFVVGERERTKLNKFDVKKVRDVLISDLYPLGRLCVYTEEAIKELGELK